MALCFIFVLLFRFIPVPITPTMSLKAIYQFYSEGTAQFKKKWISHENISIHLKSAVIKAEDIKFYDHIGFDFEAIQKAYKYNKTHSKKRGASTISQQTAKNLLLWPSRDWLRKSLEVYVTVLLELFWPKTRILEVYLNIVEFGKGIYGAEAASQYFFKKSAKNLSPSESALLSAVLPNPIRFRADRPSTYVLKRQSRILSRINSSKAEIVNKIQKDEEDQDFFQSEENDLDNTEKD